jgi:hypothetical protein
LISRTRRAAPRALRLLALHAALRLLALHAALRLLALHAALHLLAHPRMRRRAWSRGRSCCFSLLSAASHSYRALKPRHTVHPRPCVRAQPNVPAALRRKPLRFVCMTNAFAGQHEVHRRYDLKGSTTGRAASSKERAKASPVLKDLDWVSGRRTLTCRTLHGKRTSTVTTELPPSLGHKASSVEGGLLAILEADAAFLRAANLIDYSLLVGVHTKQPGEQYGARAERSPGLHVVEEEHSVQYVSIVDILTTYTFIKRLETFFLSTMLGGRDISCQPPERYAARFLAFVQATIREQP